MTDNTEIENILADITAALSPCPFIKGIVLGGSRATGTATDASDIDVGIYYEKETVDFDRLNEIAQGLDEEHRAGLICREGEWGAWVNCGGWLVIGGVHVDLIFRDIKRVQTVIEQTNEGDISSHYQTGHPHAYIDVMYRGELASSKVLYGADGSFTALKKHAELYPPKLKKALIDFFSFEAGFSCMFAETNANKGDAYYVAGHLFRSVSALNQVLFALNEKWCLNEKKATLRIDSFEKKPDDYSNKVNTVFNNIGESLAVSALVLRGLCDETIALCTERFE